MSTKNDIDEEKCYNQMKWSNDNSIMFDLPLTKIFGFPSKKKRYGH
jgi:hypothetical protein